MELKTVGIIGYGAFGALTEALIRRFAPSVGVRVYSSSHEPDGKMFFPLADTAQSDAVVLCVPIRAFEETLKKVLPLTRPDTIIVDVATVKVHTAEVLKRLAGDRLYIATHPMFGPESYAKRNESVQGFRIVIAEHTLSPGDFDSLKTSLSSAGFTVVVTTAEEHDRRLASSLFLTHFIGQIIARAGFERSDIDTVSFGHLMDAMESVRHDSALFEDVFRFNPFCAEILERFDTSEKEVLRLLRE